MSTDDGHKVYVSGEERHEYGVGFLVRRVAEDRTRWKRIVANSSVVLRRPSNAMTWIYGIVFVFGY